MSETHTALKGGIRFDFSYRAVEKGKMKRKRGKGEGERGGQRPTDRRKTKQWRMVNKS